MGGQIGAFYFDSPLFFRFSKYLLPDNFHDIKNKISIKIINNKVDKNIKVIFLIIEKLFIKRGVLLPGAPNPVT